MVLEEKQEDTEIEIQRFSGGSVISQEWTPTPRWEPIIQPNFPKNCTKKKKINREGLGGRRAVSQTLLCRYVTALVKKRF